MKTKIKSHGDEVTDFYDKETPEADKQFFQGKQEKFWSFDKAKNDLIEDSNHTCLAVISLDSSLNKDGNYYPQVFLKECKYIEKKVIRHIIDDLESSSDDSDDSDKE